MDILKLTHDDLDDIMKLEEETWPEGTRGSRENFEKRLSIFPEAVFGCRVEGVLAGLTTGMRIDIENLDEFESWENTTADGTICNHNPLGNCLYVVSVGVSPKYARRGIGRFLVKKQLELAKQLGCKFLALGSRIPGFHKYNGDVQHYMAERQNGYSIDPDIRFYQKCGLQTGEIKPNYMEDDKESRNYGVIMFKELRD